MINLEKVSGRLRKYGLCARLYAQFYFGVTVLMIDISIIKESDNLIEAARNVVALRIGNGAHLLHSKVTRSAPIWENDPVFWFNTTSDIPRHSLTARTQALQTVRTREGKKRRASERTNARMVAKGHGC